jgi:Tol biopolymer transport system component
MFKLNVLLTVLITASLSAGIFAQEKHLKGPYPGDPYRLAGEKHIRNIKMLTRGGQNAEAYLSFGQDKLIYQSDAETLGCDQIFIMNTDGSKKRMVSNGKGRTTCSYFLPGDSTIIYASTFAVDSACPPPPDMSKGYVWELYTTFDIYSANADGSNLMRLTSSDGYDAEATVSPVGDKIVFTSTRDGDPEIYTMSLDGSNQTRLTSQKGYDGGPFFSADGSKIVFRASRPKSEKELADYNDLVVNHLVRPTALEIYIMDSDGKNMTQVTKLGKASFAPFFFPDGKRIIFCSNLDLTNPRNFDLYMVNLDGSGLEQITFGDTFDGFPMFTRDGKRLVFASNRFGSKPHETNIFIADWME